MLHEKNVAYSCFLYRAHITLAQKQTQQEAMWSPAVFRKVLICSRS